MLCEIKGSAGCIGPYSRHIDVLYSFPRFMAMLLSGNLSLMLPRSGYFYHIIFYFNGNKA